MRSLVLPPKCSNFPKRFMRKREIHKTLQDSKRPKGLRLFDFFPKYETHVHELHKHTHRHTHMHTHTPLTHPHPQKEKRNKKSQRYQVDFYDSDSVTEHARDGMALSSHKIRPYCKNAMEPLSYALHSLLTIAGEDLTLSTGTYDW